MFSTHTKHALMTFVALFAVSMGIITVQMHSIRASLVVAEAQ